MWLLWFDLNFDYKFLTCVTLFEVSTWIQISDYWTNADPTVFFRSRLLNYIVLLKSLNYICELTKTH